MQKYIGVKLVESRPMSRGEYNEYRGWQIPANENPEDAGYLVCSPDGHESWLPKEQFERYYFPLAAEDGTQIYSEDIDAFITCSSDLRLGEKTTLVRIGTATGWDCLDSSSCVAPENYNHEVGMAIAMDRIKSKVRDRLGFVLQWAKNGLKFKS